MPIDRKRSAPLFATTDLATRQQIDRITKLDRRYTMSFVIEMCLKGYLNTLEAQLIRAQRRSP